MNLPYLNTTNIKIEGGYRAWAICHTLHTDSVVELIEHLANADFAYAVIYPISGETYMELDSLIYGRARDDTVKSEYLYLYVHKLTPLAGIQTIAVMAFKHATAAVAFRFRYVDILGEPLDPMLLDRET